MVASTMLLASLSLAFPASAAAVSGGFNVLSMNVAGLPAIFNTNGVPGDKGLNSATIGSKFGPYDVVQAQEDFNYHAQLYAADNHQFRTATSGPVLVGSGLNTLSKYDWVGLERVKWDSCSDISAADCFTPKGFTILRLRLDEGVYIDFYNVHADAGDAKGDFPARASNIQQLVDYIDANSAGNAVIIYGDMNSLYTRADNIRILSTQSNMTDVWVELIKDGITPEEGSEELACDNPTTDNECERLDKIFYRGNRLINLTPTYWNDESTNFLQRDGSVLTDHSPITANFTWELTEPLRQSDLFGGAYGTWFNDLDSIPTTSTGAKKPTTISLRGAERLDSISLTLADGTAYSHGGTGGGVSELTLTETEYWTSARLCRGERKGKMRNFFMTATTNEGSKVSAGTETEDCADFQAEEGWQIVGFYGAAGDEVDLLGFIYAPVGDE
ncbi:hypothetical protein FQN51_000771 [Onygenales sp. PD_10]|nr:hypothetical protein FQN51_000771 [Onygenales sp. PD_10]